MSKSEENIGVTMPRASIAWIVALMIALAALFALWRFTPLSGAITTQAVAQWAREFSESPWAVLIVFIAYTPASVVMFPRPLINIGSVVAFGPWLGSAYALTGILISGLATYVVGRMVRKEKIRRFAGERVYRATAHVRKGGIPAITAVRLVPIAPFIMINMIAGAARVSVWNFSIGTILGMVPGVVGAAIIGGALRQALHEPAEVDWRIIGAIAAATILAAFALHRFAHRSESVRSALGERN